MKPVPAPPACPMTHLPAIESSTAAAGTGGAGHPQPDGGPDVARLTKELAGLRAERQRLRAENARLQAAVRRARRLVWMLAVPWLLVAAPVALPAVWLARRRRRAQGAAPTRPPQRPLARVASRALPVHRSLIYDAFLAHTADGAERALEMLEAAGPGCPAGAKDLFRAISARSDEAWLAATNTWAKAAGLPEVALRPGPEPRFHRLSLAAAEPVLTRDKVTVIMPAFNAAGTIEQAARSILGQSWQNLELIIVDDASRDATADLAERLAAEDSRIRVLRNAVNVGPYVSKNRGLLAASGRYVTGHDADDVALPTRIADQMRPLLDDATCVATLAYMIRLDRDGRFSFPAKVGRSSYDGIARSAMISLLIDRTVLLDELGFWDSVRFNADSELLARARLVLGPRLREVRQVVMFCLNAEGSLTNDPVNGISVWEGVSPIRAAYREAYTAWHAAVPRHELRLPFPHVERMFAAPEAMIVAPEVLGTVAGPLGPAGRQAA